MNNLFEDDKKDEYIRSILRNENSINTILKRYLPNEKISSIDYDDLTDVIYYSEMTALKCRAESEEIYKEFEWVDGFNYYSNHVDLPAKAYLEDDAFIVEMPITIRRKDSKSNEIRKKNYIVASYVKAAIEQFKKENGDKSLFLNNEFTSGNLAAIIIRHAPKYNKNVHCDNDNLENGRIINVMCEALGISDNCRVLDLISCFRTREITGTTFIITKRKNITKYIYENEN